MTPEFVLMLLVCFFAGLAFVIQVLIPSLKKLSDWWNSQDD